LYNLTPVFIIPDAGAPEKIACRQGGENLPQYMKKNMTPSPLPTISPEKTGKSLSLQDFVENAIDGIFIIDRNRRLVEFNRTCEELTGYHREEVIGKNVFCARAIQCQNASGESMAGTLCPSLNVFQSDLSHQSERMKAIARDGSERWVETHYTPIYGGDGQVTYVLGIIRDITPQVLLEEEHARLGEELVHYRQEIESRYDFSKLIGNSKPILDALELAGEVAGTNTTVLITGESGTGKELLARAIHFNSPRKGGSLVAVNCAAFPEQLLESELFGYDRGAFTGAERTKPGRFELAHGGTLFLDEIAETSLTTQAKLLRVIQEREVEHLGGTRPIQVNVRIITATNRNLEERVREGLFRQDLYYRISVFPIRLPPLRERRQDILPLAGHFLEKFAMETGKKVPGISREARKLLLDHHWDGNVRELQNVIERAVILCRGELITSAHLPIGDSGDHPTHGKNQSLQDLFSLPEEGLSLEELEKSLLKQALTKSHHNKTRAAVLLGLTRSTLRYRLEKYGLEGAETSQDG
jgi:PAS domain S-box-containing protein